MIIEYLGHSCFKLTESTGTCVVCDPYSKVKTAFFIDNYRISANVCNKIMVVMMVGNRYCVSRNFWHGIRKEGVQFI